MATKTMTELEERKRKLAEELDQIQEDLDESVDDVKRDITSKTNPAYWVQNYPFETVGGALLGGFLIGYRPNSRGSVSSSTSQTSSSSSSGGGLKETLINELKRIAMKKAMEKFSEILDAQMKKRL